MFHILIELKFHYKKDKKQHTVIIVDQLVIKYAGLMMIKKKDVLQ